MRSANAEPVWAVVPVKHLIRAKTRLGRVLSLSARRELVLTMFEDVLAMLRGTPAIGPILVVTADRWVAAIGERHGARILREERSSGLNAALRRGAHHAFREGGTRVLFIPADVPLATSAEIARVVDEPSDRDRGVVVIVPAEVGGGTNALLLSPPDALAPHFGEDSFAAHCRQALKGGLVPKVLRLNGLGRDIDEPTDLALLLERRRGSTPMPFCGRHCAITKLVSTACPGVCWKERRPQAVRNERGMMNGIDISRVLGSVENGERLDRQEALALAACEQTDRLAALAQRRCVAGHGKQVSFSKKVFIPLTRLCADVCHYCTFARAPRRGEAAYLSAEAVLDIARRGAEQGVKEALFTLGDKPERRYARARQALVQLGHGTTLDYLEASAALVLEKTGLLPHLNPGLLNEVWAGRLRRVSASQGIMLETSSERLSRCGGPHFGSPDKHPSARLAAIDAAGRAGVPFTTGILIGIGETRLERIEALLAIRDLHERHGHIQEVIVQNFRAKPGTLMVDAPEPSLDEQIWTIAVARLILGQSMNIQTPPNLRPDDLEALIRAGINDWGGVSPVTPDHVNPEAPWPHLQNLARATERAGRVLVERLAIYPTFAVEPRRWIAREMRTPVLRLSDGQGFAREDPWFPGGLEALPVASVARLRREGAALSRSVADSLGRIEEGSALDEAKIEALFEARGADFSAVCRAADRLRKMRVDEGVSYVVNRNINYTNICTYGCRFCAFSKGRHNLGHRDTPYDLGLD
ncbi:MAG: 7,8-didemethyl-8-hydroxy-5-deazariboflavin synthase CofG, partial [Hyphomicrobiales bacterium]|nr:7,8-didemethyl-8-hydroxy-5-deazariboflavin synthase CofG [Hyphomicrobiales bacterium]